MNKGFNGENDMIVNVHYVFDIGEIIPYIITIVHARTVPDGKTLDERIAETAKFIYNTELLSKLNVIVYVINGEFHTINL